MKRCATCGKDIPESSAHCAFCGAKQPEGGAAKTMMGYPGLAEQVLERAAAERAAAERPAAARPPSGGPVDSLAETQPIAPTARPQPAPHTQPSSQPVPSFTPPQRPPTPRPAPQQPPPPQAAPVVQPDPPAQPQAFPQGSHHAPPAQAPPFAQGSHHAPPTQAYGGAAPAYHGMAAPAPHMPPYRASETEMRANAPQEPWARLLRTALMVFGVLLIAAFFAPWAISDRTIVFSWDVMKGEGGSIVPLALIGSGVVFTALALIDVGTPGRGVAAAVVGLGAILYMATGAFGDLTSGLRGGGFGGDLGWRGIALLPGVVVLAAGLFVRSQYPTAMAGRALASVGIAALLAFYLVPESDVVPVVGLLDMLADGGTEERLLAAYFLGGFALALLGLLVWLPRTTTAGTGAVAWLAAAWLPSFLPLLFAGLLITGRGDAGEVIKGGLSLLYHLPVALLAWYLLGALGLATLIGKRLEHI